GLLGAAAVAALCIPLSQLTFGTGAYAVPVAFLGLVVVLKLNAGGHMAIIQGTRRIADLAQLNILGALAGLGASIPLILLFGEAGIVPALILTAAAASILAWYYGRRIPAARLPAGQALISRQATDLLRLGIAFMISGFLTMGAAYL